MIFSVRGVESSYMPTSRTEALGRALFAHYLPFLKPQYNIRPEWLTWPVTGNRLELDIYYPEIKVAIELDGVQHGRPIIGMQKDFAAFERQQARDLWKMERCQELGITLYKLTIFDLTLKRFYDHLLQILVRGIDATQSHSSVRVNYALRGVQMKLAFMERPDVLFAEAEKLSRQKFRPPHAPKKRQPGIIPLLKRMIGVS